MYANNQGYIQLNKGCNFELALKDLLGIERIWVVFQFHKNSSWKPLVSPPVVEDNKKIGVFATRSPHRPNSLGLSCLLLNRVEGLKVFVEKCDLLNGSPIFDIKPYIPTSDSFPKSKTGWLKPKKTEDIYAIKYSDDVIPKIEFLNLATGLNFKGFIELQLEYQPLNFKRKRIKIIDDSFYVLSFRTWRIKFKIKNQYVVIVDVYSGYSLIELTQLAQDKYQDKQIHIDYLKNFKT